MQQLLADLPLSLLSLDDFPPAGDVEETGATFEENAALKARAYAARTQCWALADDSGLEVDALGGAPGVLSARYAGDGATEAERNAKLLNALSRTGDRERRARFVCCVAVADPQGNVAHLSVGKCEGVIADAPRGHNGFGYDPLFVPEGYGLTFGELSDDIKGEISHRARALAQARAFLLEHFRAEA
jgi:XTP/dITP diphosphohydrolase